MLDFVWLIPIFPLIGVIVNGLLGSRLSTKAVSWIGCGMVGLSCLFSISVFISLLQLAPADRVFEKTLYSWVVSGDFQAPFGLQIDPLSVVMILVVSGVGFLIHIYSVGYMHDDRGYARYFTYLNLFTFSMLILVLANNFLLMFVGWEGVGLCSYLLIGYWYERKSASDAGKKAFIVNRIGDFGFLLAIMLIFATFGTVNFGDVFRQAPNILEAGGITVVAITLLLFLGATGKSAQIPLYTWLPDAMEGPTPVSALIHAATMVTAGVYMVARCNVLYNLAPFSMQVVAVIGAVTAIFTASIGLVQTDIKRVLAYSTISQLGYMFLACGVGAFTAGIFHLFTHAFFKALLFLAAGSVIHALSGEMDIRKMGGLKPHLPTTYWTFLIAALAIAGIFPFSGFFSKDEILWKALVNGGIGFWIVGAVAALMTAFYIFRLIFLTFHGTTRVDHEVAHHIHESPKVMTLPLMILAIFSASVGFLGIPIIKGGNVFGEFLAPVFGVHAVHETGSVNLEAGMMMVSLVIALSGIALAYFIYVADPKRAEVLGRSFSIIHRVLYRKYYVDEIYDTIIVRPFVKIAQLAWSFFDTVIVDGIVNGIAKLIVLAGNGLRRLQSGFVQDYALAIVLGVVLILGYCFLR